MKFALPKYWSETSIIADCKKSVDGLGNRRSTMAKNLKLVSLNELWERTSLSRAPTLLAFLFLSL